MESIIVLLTDGELEVNAEVIQLIPSIDSYVDPVTIIIKFPISLNAFSIIYNCLIDVYTFQDTEDGIEHELQDRDYDDIINRNIIANNLSISLMSYVTASFDYLGLDYLFKAMRDIYPLIATIFFAPDTSLFEIEYETNDPDLGIMFKIDGIIILRMRDQNNNIRTFNLKVQRKDFYYLLNPKEFLVYDIVTREIFKFYFNVNKLIIHFDNQLNIELPYYFNPESEELDLDMETMQI
jgi:hypothetical protein